MCSFAETTVVNDDDGGDNLVMDWLSTWSFARGSKQFDHLNF